MAMTKWFGVYAIAGILVLCGALGCSSGGGGPGGFGGLGGAQNQGGASSSGGSGSSSSSGVATGSGSSGGGATGSSGGLGSSGAGGSGGPSSSSGSDAGSATGDAGQSDPDIAYSVTLTMDTFSVPAGQEVYMCQDFANPFHGQQADIKTYELHMAAGSHHMFAFYKTNATNTPVTTCPQGGLQFAPFTFTAQSPDVVETYPQGVGATIPATTGFTLNVHYINPGTTPITGHVTLTMSVAKSGIVTQHAGVLFLNQALLSVPATGQPATSTSQYTLPQDVYLMTSGSHMHKRATNFVATASSGQMLFQTTQWAEPPPATYAPPIHLSSGTSISWSCTYVNDTGQTLTFGESANTNVMCISVSIFYPVQNINNPVIGTQF